MDYDSPKKLIIKHIGTEVVEINVGSESSYWKSKLKSLNISYQNHESKLFAFFNDQQSRQNFINLLQNVHYVTRDANLNDVFLKIAGYEMRSES